MFSALPRPGLWPPLFLALLIHPIYPAPGAHAADVPGVYLENRHCEQFLTEWQGDQLADRLEGWFSGLKQAEFTVTREPKAPSPLARLGAPPLAPERPWTYAEKVALGINPARPLEYGDIDRVYLSADRRKLRLTAVGAQGAELGRRTVYLSHLRLGFYHRLNQWQINRFLDEPSSDYTLLEPDAAIRRFLIAEGVVLLAPIARDGTARGVGYLVRLNDIDVEENARSPRLELVSVRNCARPPRAKHEVIFPVKYGPRGLLNLCLTSTRLTLRPPVLP